MTVDPRITARFDRYEIVAVYRAIRDAAGREDAKQALATMDAEEFGEHFDNAAGDGYYRMVS